MDRLPTGHFSGSSRISQGTLDPGWLVGPGTVIALALLSIALGQTDTPLPIVDSPATSQTSTAPSDQALSPPQMPTIGMTRPLSVDEIRWCLSQNVAFQTMQPLLGTLAAFDHYNELGEDFNLRCGARHYNEDRADEASRLVDRDREEIAAAAIEDIQRLNDPALTRRIQGILVLLGYEIETDGVYGTDTKKVIQSFQHRVGMPADGLISESLLDHLKVAHMRFLTGRGNSRSPVE